MAKLSWKKFVTYTICMVTIGLSPVLAADIGVSERVAKCFDGYTGIFVMHDAAGKAVCEYNNDQASKGLSPNSTFKIALGLIGLETGVIKDENALEKWDGSKEPIDTWNKDHSLKTATNESVNWYFHKVSKKIGQAELAKYLKLLHYGNEDISSGT